MPTKNQTNGVFITIKKNNPTAMIEYNTIFAGNLLFKNSRVNKDSITIKPKNITKSFHDPIRLPEDIPLNNVGANLLTSTNK